MNAVQDFFKTNPKLKVLAEEARTLLLSTKYFPRSKVYFVHDYDMDVKKEIVWIIISTNLSYEEAYQRLDEFDKWWMPALKKAEGKLGISVKAKDYF